ncbi:MAG TPA: metallophosphoesterase [Spirochaetia bacterium]
MTILCLSDIHGETAGLRELLPIAAEVDVVVVAGDITHLGGFDEARAALTPLLENGARLVAVGGNMDKEGARRFLEEAGIDLHGRGTVIGGIGFMGLGGGTPSPFGTPWEIGNEEATRVLAAALSPVKDVSYRVLVSHAPPKGTQLDRSFTKMHVGSPAVRDFLLAGSARLCLCGHIHESWGEDRLGAAHCVNIGPFKNGRYALVTIENDEATVTWRTR